MQKNTADQSEGGTLISGKIIFIQSLKNVKENRQWNLISEDGFPWRHFPGNAAPVMHS
jgi:hypothetical protein